MSLGWLPCLLFLLAASRQDARGRTVSRLLLLVWTLVGLGGAVLGAWAWSFAGVGLGFAILWLAGVPSGDRLGGAVAGGFLGLPVGYAAALALLGAWLGWRRWGSERSPADFAFYPFLLAGTATVILSLTIYATL